jgi:hypothetical protein
VNDTLEFRFELIGWVEFEMVASGEFGDLAPTGLRVGIIDVDEIEVPIKKHQARLCVFEERFKDPRLLGYQVA